MQILSECNLAELVVELLSGKTVVFPTETSYGLGCDATNQEAVDKIFKIKGRGSNKPLLVVVPSIEEAKKYLVWNDILDKLSKEFWPGSLTVVGSLAAPPFKEGAGGGQYVHKDMRMIAFNRTLDKRRELRQEKTKAEDLLWKNLRAKRLGGLKFRRQHGIGKYIVDFYQPDSKYIIEVDGDIHFIEDKKIESDKDRTKWLESMGYKVMRFNNVDIFSDLQGALDHIYYNVNLALTSFPPLSLKGESDSVTSSCPLLKRRGYSELANGVVSKNGTLALRVTAHPLLKSITEKLGRPLVATSANISDTGDIYNVDEVIKQFQNRGHQPDIVLNYGELPKRKPTTIVSVVGGELRILRQGEVAIQEIK